MQLFGNTSGCTGNVPRGSDAQRVLRKLLNMLDHSYKTWFELVTSYKLHNKLKLHALTAG